MFVRWERRERVSVKRRRLRDERGRKHYVAAPPRKTGEFVLVVRLVKSERRDGKPRQKVVAYLGIVREEYAEHPTHREAFWRRASARLDALGLDPEERGKIEAALLARVPRPSAEEVAAAERKRHEEMQALLEQIKGIKGM
jgi:hypothetical protein